MKGPNFSPQAFGLMSKVYDIAISTGLGGDGMEAVRPADIAGGCMDSYR